MADSTIDSELIALKDLWPGTPTSRLGTPTGGFTGSSHHNVPSPAYPVGTKIEVYNKGTKAGQPGFATLMYLKVGTQNAAVAIAAKSVCVCDSAADWYKVTNDPDDCVKKRGMPVAVALSTMTDGNYGWFWVGGVCPEEFIANLGGNYATDGTVAAGPICVGDLAADAMGFSATVDGSTAGTTPAATPADWACGFAIAADAA